MKIKKIAAVIVAAALTLSLSITPISAEVDDANIIGNKYHLELAKRFLVGEPGTAILNAQATIPHLSDRIEIAIYDSMFDMTKPISIEVISKDGVVFFKDSIIFEGTDSNFIPGTVDIIGDDIIIEENTFIDDSGYITVRGTVNHYEKKQIDLYDTYNSEYPPLEICDDSDENRVSAYTFRSFVPLSTKEVRMPFRSGLNDKTQADAPKELLQWLSSFPLPEAAFNYETYRADLEDIMERNFEIEVAGAADPDIDAEDVLELCRWLNINLSRPNVADLAKIEEIRTAILSKPENFAYEVVKTLPNGDIVPDPTRQAINNYYNVRALINDNKGSYDGMRFTFHTAVDNVVSPEYLKANLWYVEREHVNPSGMYATGTMGKDRGDASYKYAFSQSLYNNYGVDPSGNVPFDPYIYFTNGIAYNLNTAALVVNGQYTMQLADTVRFGYGATTVVFEYTDIEDNIYTQVNPFLNMITDIRFATSIPWYWDSVDIEFYPIQNPADELDPDDDFTNDEPVEFE
ncbi:MAG: hypothetical protein LBM41_02755 [Ruminococcus sp.]|jgi:hypothetical protein|nr:hypothetical protein [Ruminococcus sp.]